MAMNIKELFPEHYDYSFWDKDVEKLGEVDLFNGWGGRCDLTLNSNMSINDYNKGDLLYIYDGEYRWTAEVVGKKTKRNALVVVVY